MSLLDTAFSMTNMFQRIQFKLIKIIFLPVGNAICTPPQNKEKNSYPYEIVCSQALYDIFSQINSTIIKIL